MPESKLFFFIISFPMFAIGQGLPKGIDTIINKSCDSQYVYTTIIRANKLKKYFPKNVFDKFYNLPEHHLNIDNPAEKKELIKAISQFYEQSNAQKSISRLIKNWCLENTFLNALSTNLEFPPEAILYNTGMTKFLVQRYIPKTLPSQDWSSLASYQLYELDIDYLNYLDTLTNSEKKELYRALRITSKKHK
jgi:hypothetical protein